jgi:hypothetical protein
MGIDAIAFGLGAILLLVGILGGGFELREFKVPPVGKALRLIATAIGLFFILVGIGLHASVNAPDNGSGVRGQTNSPDNGFNPPTQTQPPPSAPVDPVALHKPGLISAIRLADNAEAEANLKLDPSPLYGIYTGEALRMALANVESLRSNNLCQESVLEDQNFQDFKVSSDQSAAEVRVVETWSSVVYQASTGQCLQRIPSHKVPQTIYLKRGEKGWIVDAVVHDLVTPNPIPCY